MPLPAGADAEKFAIIDCEKFMVMLQVSVTPGQFAPGALPVFQPAEAKPVVGEEIRVTTAPVAKVAELGGTALAGVMDIGVGKIAPIQDPQGAVFALYSGEFED